MTATNAITPRGLQYEVLDRETQAVLSTHSKASGAVLAAHQFYNPAAVIAVETVYLADGTKWRYAL